MARPAVLVFLFAVLLTGVRCQPVSESKAKGGLVRKAIDAIIATKSKYPDYGVFISYLQLARSLKAYNTTNMDVLFNTTVLIPSNAAAGKMTRLVRKGISNVVSVIGYHLLTTRLSTSLLKAAGTNAQAFSTPVAPPLFNASKTVYLALVRRSPSFYIQGSRSKVVAKIRDFALTPGNNAVLKALYPVGVNNVLIPN